jgi:hypothetical protein
MSAIIVYPVGRFIGGSLKDMHPRTEQDGKTPKRNAAGEVINACNFGVAIQKTQADWRNEVWGQIMFGIGKAAEPTLHLAAAFAWKIVDGDDARPNKNGKVPSQQEGYAGHWVIWFSQGWLPTLCSADGSITLQPGAIMPGQYVQVQADVASNGAKPPQTPGLYLNPKAVALAADGPRIVSNDVDTTKSGFGGVALPAGALPLTPAIAAFAVAQPSVAAVAPPSMVAVTPNAAFMSVPPPPPAAAQAHTMTALAGGTSYEAMLAVGWNDALLRQHGMMQ